MFIKVERSLRKYLPARKKEDEEEEEDSNINKLSNFQNVTSTLHYFSTFTVGIEALIRARHELLYPLITQGHRLCVQPVFHHWSHHPWSSAMVGKLQGRGKVKVIRARSRLYSGWSTIPTWIPWAAGLCTQQCGVTYCHATTWHAKLAGHARLFWIALLSCFNISQYTSNVTVVPGYIKCHQQTNTFSVPLKQQPLAFCHKMFVWISMVLVNRYASTPCNAFSFRCCCKKSTSHHQSQCDPEISPLHCWTYCWRNVRLMSSLLFLFIRMHFGHQICTDFMVVQPLCHNFTEQCMWNLWKTRQ